MAGGPMNIIAAKREIDLVVARADAREAGDSRGIAIEAAKMKAAAKRDVEENRDALELREYNWEAATDWAQVGDDLIVTRRAF